MKALHCSDAGFDCKTVIHGTTNEAIIAEAGKHAKEVHGVEVTPELAEQLISLIREEN